MDILQQKLQAVQSVLNSGTDGSTPNKSLREKNDAAIKRVTRKGPEVKAFAESTKKMTKRIFGEEIDLVNDNAKFPVMNESFSWKRLQAKLTEADASSSFTQFLRAGLQQLVNGMYESVPVTYKDWVKVIASGKDTELYAPNQGVAFPRQVGPNEKYPEVGVAALDIQLKNLKFGSMYAVEMELLDDDQSGTFSQQAGLLGEYMQLVAEVLCYGKLASVAGMKYIDYTVPVSETKPSYETNYPYTTSAAPFRGGGYNRPVTYTVLTQAGVQNGIIGLMAQKNLQGIKMLVQPSRLVISPKTSFDAAVLIHSAYYPSGAAAAGNVGGAFAINPIKGILDITVSRFVFKNDGTVNGDSNAWYIMDDSKPWFILQLREAVSVMQENVASGESFERDVYRFKARTRMNADFIDPRFVWQGNDGSV